MSVAEEKYVEARMSAVNAIHELYEAEQEVGFDKDSIAQDFVDIVHDATDGKITLCVE